MNEAASIPCNDSLNRPKHRFGLDYRVALACIGVAVLVGELVNLLLGVVLLFALPASVGLVLKKDPQMYRLWVLSFLQYAHYDPGKVRK